jgi:hypothetical protein
MKQLLLGLVAGATILLTGCVVMSVYPFYTQRDLVFETKLLGDWVTLDADDADAEFCRIEKFGETGYRATCFGRNETNSVDAHLFRLHGQLFLDTCPTNRSFDALPVHQLQKVRCAEGLLETVSLNYNWLAEQLQKTPDALRHIVVLDKNNGRENRRIVLTANTAELQQFVLQHLNNPNAWNEPSTCKVRPKVQTTTNAPGANSLNVFRPLRASGLMNQKSVHSTLAVTAKSQLDDDMFFPGLSKPASVRS